MIKIILHRNIKAYTFANVKILLINIQIEDEETGFNAIANFWTIQRSVFR